jgi:iron-sulfur cluster assembly accessory protein
MIIVPLASQGGRESHSAAVASNSPGAEVGLRGKVPLPSALCYNSAKEICMATTSVPEVKTNPTEVKKVPPVMLSPNAIAKVKEIMGQQNPVPAGLRIGVVGGGCSGFSYSMQFENAAGMMDKTFEMDGLKVFVDATSVMYLNGCVVDYVETLEGAGFKFENPNVKSTCGCGSSFSV